MKSLQSEMELGIPFFCEDCYTSNLCDLSWSSEVEGFGLMCRCYALNGLESCFSMKILSKGKSHTPNITYDIDSKS
jgi:hypothetical protein